MASFKINRKMKTSEFEIAAKQESQIYSNSISETTNPIHICTESITPSSSATPTISTLTLNSENSQNENEQRKSDDSEEKSCKQKTKNALFGILRGLALIPLLYFFICSLEFLSDSFRLIAGKTAGIEKLFRKSYQN